MTGAVSPATPNIVMAVPCFSGGKPSIRIPWLAGWSPPPAMPWITRKRISCSRLVARPHSTEAAVKTAMERRKYLRRPRRAESQPVIGRMVALAAR